MMKLTRAATLMAACWGVALVGAATIHDWSGRVTAQVASVVSVRDEQELATLFHDVSIHGGSIKILGAPCVRTCL